MLNKLQIYNIYISFTVSQNPFLEHEYKVKSAEFIKAYKVFHIEKYI